MKRLTLTMLILTTGLLAGAGIPNFFSGLIGKNVQKYCEEKSGEEQQELIQSVNLYTGTHKVVVVCGEKIAKANPAESDSKNTARIRHK